MVSTTDGTNSTNPFRPGHGRGFLEALTETAMTIEQVKAKVTRRDLETRSVHVQTTLTRRIDPIIVIEIRM